MQTELEELAAINRGADGSCCRLALTDADRRGRDLVVSWMRNAELDVNIDRIGNIIGTRAGTQSGPPVMTGSHIDTVATGGRYDGAYGVVAGIEVVRALNARKVLTKRPLAVVVFTNEEGVRFAPDMMGSLVYAGGLLLEDALQAVSEDGAVLGEELARIGYAGSKRCGEIRPHAFVELHIEQGPVLDRANEVLAVVQDLQGISWQEVNIRGVSNHAGTTPMNLRHDAAYGAGMVTVFVRKLAQRMGGSQVATIGSVRLVPNLVNVIAREAKLTVDLRNSDDAALSAAEQELEAFLVEIADAEGLIIETKRLVRTQPVRFDDRILETIEQVAAKLGHGEIRRMTSGAGHDAQMMARICPAAMIFVPSVNGISHNPKEFTLPRHLEDGANVLLHAMKRIANE
jgi:N-carbamoyl-L-amino-acid hydrolase